MSEVKDLRVALERLREGLHPQSCCNVERALVSEGLAACDEWESVEDGDYTADNIAQGKVDLLAAILRKAGLL